MKILKLLITIIILMIQAHQAQCVENVTQPDAQSVMSQWFSIDSEFDIKMQKSIVEDNVDGNDAIKKINLSFTSDDQQLVNGVLAIPHAKKRTLKIGLVITRHGNRSKLMVEP